MQHATCEFFKKKRNVTREMVKKATCDMPVDKNKRHVACEFIRKSDMIRPSSFFLHCGNIMQKFYSRIFKHKKITLSLLKFLSRLSRTVFGSSYKQNLT